MSVAFILGLIKERLNVDFKLKPLKQEISYPEKNLGICDEEQQF
jgi:hypothetical protein